ncbi:MAG TPA: adenylate/guanylate cyclase domain-containing protein [Kofleriaceae bacterium]
MLSFALLSIIPLIVILAYGYHRNEAAITQSLDEQLARDSARSIHRVAELVDDVVKAASIVGAAVEADPTMFHSEKGDSIIWRAVASSPEIDALYVSFEDGHHRVVSRIDDDRRRSDPRIPAGATWHASYVDDFTAGAARARHRRFFATWPTEISSYSDPTTIDIRTLPQYAGAKARDGLAVAEPGINPDTGYPILSIGWPVHQDGKFIGFVGANMTLSAVSTYLREHRFSPNSITVIVDDAGHVIAHPDPKESIHIAGGKTELAKIADLSDKRIGEALAHRDRGTHFRFTSSGGEDLAVATEPFPTAFGKSWEVVIVAPTADFVGTLESTNRNVFAMLAFALVLELVFIYLLSRYIARHIARVSAAFASARRLSFVAPAVTSSFIGEISDLEGGFALLQNALSSFAKFVPADVVTRFIESGKPVAPGVEQREATIFFCDLEGFSGQAENLTPAQLLAQLTQYFATMTGAIAEERGTIDKFIGDAVMAFWGAPVADSDDTLRACRAAVRAQRRMEKLQAVWRAAGQPVMNVRIGIHSSSVLVGNIGSPERLSYTAIGDGVNVASRLEAINKTFGSTVCVSDTTLAALGGRAIARPLRPVRVKGRRQEFMIYELLAIAGTDEPELGPRPDDEELVLLSTKAADARRAGDVPGAMHAYEAVLARFADDRVTRLLLDELRVSPHLEH